MTKEDLRDQIESLRAEVRDINHILVNLRREDVSDVFAKQIRSVLLEKNDRFFMTCRETAYSEDDRELMARIERETSDMIDALVTSIVHDDEKRTLSLIENYRARWQDDERSRGWKGLENYVDETLRQVTSYVDTAALMRARVEPWHGDGGQVKPLDADMIENALAPLANAVRVKVMIILRREPLGLTDLCRHLDLQKGHLQFHLRTLIEAGLVSMDRRTKQYSISSKGSVVLDSLSNMMAKIG